MTTIVKSKMINNENINLVIKTGALSLVEASRGVMVPINVLDSLTMKDFVEEATSGTHPLINEPYQNVKDPTEQAIVPSTEVPYGKPEENVNLEETPAQTINETIASPSIEEINMLRAVLADASNKITRLQDNLDELQQLLQTTLDSGKEFVEDKGMSM